MTEMTDMLLKLLLAAVSAVIVLQFVIIAMLSKSKKQGVGAQPGHSHRRVGVASGDVRADKGPQAQNAARRDGGSYRKTGDGRDAKPRPQSGRPQGQNQGQQSQGQDRQQQAAAIDPMERSLRDINMRLKNAEREQENARRKIQESAKDGVSREVNRDGGRDNGNRDGNRDGGRDGGYPRGDRNGRPDRGPRRDFHRIERRPEPPRDDAAIANAANAIPAPPPMTETAPAPAMPYVAPQQFQPESAPPPVAAAPQSFAAENGGDLQHGRRFINKRRVLSETVSPPESTGEAPPPMPPPEASFAPPVDSAPDAQYRQEQAPPQEWQGGAGDVRYGR